ncbi:hypothetical protein [Peptoniphilus harei]|uniref:hypothetical protein n=1 Tax=Peptoniphilus harei TaxID=54005 RepID=UPI00211499AB|nr:hypothetical protein [Peptoniphilus harei]
MLGIIFCKTFGGTNGVKVWGETSLPTNQGPGAGKLETADAVMRDLLRILAKKRNKNFL